MGFLAYLISLIIFLFYCFWKGIRRDEERRRLMPNSNLTALAGRRISVRCIDDEFKPENNGDSLPLKKIAICGAILAPKPNQRVRIRIALTDVTSKTGDPLPVFCMIPDLSDEEGVYSVDQPTTIPYQISEMRDMVVGVIPLFALVCPARGTRRLRLSVEIVDAGDPKRVFKRGKTTFEFEQDVLGYTEIRERTVAQERRIASLALAVSASDGFMDRRESTVLRRFFAERYARLDDADERREEITEALQETLVELKEDLEDPSEMIARLCRELAEDGDEAAIQTAYELCVQVVAADETVDMREQGALAYIAERLDLPDEFVRETHERSLRIAMYDEVDDEQLIGMPSGLSDDEKREFLNKEYRKWRGRVTHKDPAVAAEATLRIERIRKLRRKLSNDIS